MAPSSPLKGKENAPSETALATTGRPESNNGSLLSANGNGDDSRDDSKMSDVWELPPFPIAPQDPADPVAPRFAVPTQNSALLHSSSVGTSIDENAESKDLQPSSSLSDYLSADATHPPRLPPLPSPLADPSNFQPKQWRHHQHPHDDDQSQYTQYSQYSLFSRCSSLESQSLASSKQPLPPLPGAPGFATDAGDATPREALRYLLRYERMVRRQMAEEEATWRYLRPLFDRLCVLGGAIDPGTIRSSGGARAREPGETTLLPPPLEQPASSPVQRPIPRLTTPTKEVNSRSACPALPSFETPKNNNRTTNEGSGSGTPPRSNLSSEKKQHLPYRSMKVALEKLEHFGANGERVTNADVMIGNDRQLIMILRILSSMVTLAENRQEGSSDVEQEEEEGLTYPEFVQCYRTVAAGTQATQRMVKPEPSSKSKERALRRTMELVRSFGPSRPLDDQMPDGPHNEKSKENVMQVADIDPCQTLTPTKHLHDLNGAVPAPSNHNSGPTMCQMIRTALRFVGLSNVPSANVTPGRAATDIIERGAQNMASSALKLHHDHLNHLADDGGINGEAVPPNQELCDKIKRNELPQAEQPKDVERFYNRIKTLLGEELDREVQDESADGELEKYYHRDAVSIGK